MKIEIFENEFTGCTNEFIKFNTGKIIDIYKDGVIGLSSNFKVCYGYDTIFMDSDITTEEKIELANYMIQHWIEYKEGINSGQKNNM